MEEITDSRSLSLVRKDLFPVRFVEVDPKLSTSEVSGDEGKELEFAFGVGLALVDWVGLGALCFCLIASALVVNTSKTGVFRRLLGLQETVSSSRMAGVTICVAYVLKLGLSAPARVG